MKPTRALVLATLLLAPPNPLQAADFPSTLPPQHLGAPKSEHAVTHRAFTGIPSLTITARGRLWAVWYAGITPAEDKNNYNQLIVMTSFTEDDILAADHDARLVEVFRRRSVISDGGEIEDSGPNPKAPVRAKEPAL